jgi:hypothetical protein
VVETLGPVVLEANRSVVLLQGYFSLVTIFFLRRPSFRFQLFKKHRETISIRCAPFVWRVRSQMWRWDPLQGTAR